MYLLLHSFLFVTQFNIYSISEVYAMNICIIGLLFTLELSIFFLFGLLFFKIVRLTPSSMTLTLVTGFFFNFCFFGILALPLILTSQKLSTLTYGTIILTTLVCLISIILCYQNLKYLLLSFFRSFKQHSFMLVPLFLAIFLLQLTVFTHIDTSADASYYIGKVTTDVYTNSMGHYNPYNGHTLHFLDARRVYACYPEYNAVISQFFHVHPLKQSKLIMVQILALFTSILYYQIGLLLFNKSQKKADAFVFLLFMLDLYSYTLYTNSTFLLTRTYEGKSILANILIPGMFLCFILLWKNPKDKFPKYALFLISLSSCFFSSSSMLIIPTGLSAGLIPLIWKQKEQKILKLYIICIIPNLVICILYLLSSIGFLSYPI